MFWFDKVINLGIEDNMSSEMIVNLKTTNIINFILIIAFITLAILFAFVEPALFKIVVIGFFLTAVSMLFQYNYLTKVSRVITSCATATIADCFYLQVIGVSGDSEAILFSAAAMLIFFPFFLFSANEFPFTLLTFIWNFSILLMCQNWLPELSFGPGYPEAKSIVIQNLLLFVAAICVAGSAFNVKYASKIESERVEQLLQEREKEKQEAQNRETQLNEMLLKLKEAQKEEEKRIWSSKGLAEIGKILREMKDEQQVADQLVAFLVKYLDANQGAIFTLVNNEFFMMRSCYAYERKKYIDKKIRVGEGIIGQSYFEKTFTHITKVPPDYIHITSGLGFATPRSLLVVPLIANDEVHGAMEFASFTKFEKHQIDFLTDVGENMAIALLNIATNERTRELLNETQNMAEEMRTQEEEMRQNMEELAATQEQQFRNEQMLRALLEEKDKMIEELKNRLPV